MSTGRLRGKVAIVTGAASQGPGLGTGKAISLTFAREGARVVLVNRTIERAQELQKEIEAEGGECLACSADVTKASQVEEVVSEVLSRFNRLDVLVNNVGGGKGGIGSVVQITEDAWDAMLDLNLKSVMLCGKYCIPPMIERGGGSIINVSSIAAVFGGQVPGSGADAYTASKAGVEGLTRAMAADFAKQGIRVNSLLVGAIWTPMVAHLGEEARERRRMGVPLETEGTAWDVAWAALYLASDESKWVTGISLIVDGGMTGIRKWPS